MAPSSLPPASPCSIGRRISSASCSGFVVCEIDCAVRSPAVHEHPASTEELVLRFDRAPDVHRAIVVHADASRSLLSFPGSFPRSPVKVPDRAPFSDLVTRISAEMTALDGALAIEGLLLELIARLVRAGRWPSG